MKFTASKGLSSEYSYSEYTKLKPNKCAVNIFVRIVIAKIQYSSGMTKYLALKMLAFTDDFCPFTEK